MSRIHDRQKAIDLRKEGRTYPEIRQLLGVAKSTLSEWLKNYPLTDAQLQLLAKTKQKNRYVAIERIRITKQRKREKRLDDTYLEEKKRWIHLTQRELELAGVFLYWGEGAKHLRGPLSLNNTDPEVMKFTLYWMVYGLKIPKERIKVCLHLYKDMDIAVEKNYWSEVLHMPLSQFATPYIKESLRSSLTHKGFGHGTCGLLVSNIRLKEQVMMTIKAISDSYNAKI